MNGEPDNLELDDPPELWIWREALRRLAHPELFDRIEVAAAESYVETYGYGRLQPSEGS